MHERLILPNGVRIVYEHMPFVRTAAVGISVGVGSRDEKRSEGGFAHFIEHMRFKGTAHYSAAELAGAMDSVGGQYNAYTTRENTAFYARVLDEHLDTAIDLLREAFVLSPSVWSDTMAAVCGVTGVVLAVGLGFVSAVSPALKSASMDPQTAITRGEVN